MRIDEKVLGKLDFNRLRDRLAGFCHLTLAQDKALTLLPVADYGQVSVLLQETEEGRDLLRLRPSFSVRGSKEIHDCLTRCEHGGTLTGVELANIKDTLRVAKQVGSVIRDNQPACGAACGGLAARVANCQLSALGRSFAEISLLTALSNCQLLTEALAVSISEEGEVTDRASVELANIRGAVATARQRIKGALDQVIRNAAYQKMLQDPIVTTRGDRYVVPVKQEYVAAFPGIVHDQSASGATAFIEPMAVVPLGNSLREGIMREKREVERILRVLTDRVAERLDDIWAVYGVLVAVDFVLAKARLANEMGGEIPELAHEPEVKLVGARHPLLEGDVVPLSVELGREYDWLVITGPNTGGKTVALKTLALMVIMTQCGLLIPVGGHSRLGVFEAVFADIGDEQSVEQSLSTFSGHMANVIQILREADGMSLVFFDEIGAGTDPAEGAALAMAVLEELLGRGCRGMATTHYGALKTFAYNTPRVENASVEFDAESLRPTYRLLSGVPGRSNAFVIAERLGLNADILNKAQEHLAERQTQMAHLLESLEETQRSAQVRTNELQTERDHLDQMKADWYRERAEAEERTRVIESKARDQALQLVQSARQESGRIIKEIKEAQKKDRREQDQVIERVRQDTKRLAERLDQDREGSASASAAERHLRAPDPGQVMPGLEVFLPHLNEKGVVVSAPDKNNEVVVQAGILKITLPLDKVALGGDLKGRKSEARGGSSLTSQLSKAATVRREVDLRGKLVDEAVEVLDKYMDDAVLAGIHVISVIHGKGTGALRAAVQSFLKGHPRVAAFRLGEAGEGDSGVTIIELK
ncbi:MAG: endonuclease MutS2 [Peptococcaceae bacterium]|nr:endonuclease MutS2 [Peptococcaceae bacterium]